MKRQISIPRKRALLLALLAAGLFVAGSVAAAEGWTPFRSEPPAEGDMNCSVTIEPTYFGRGGGRMSEPECHPAKG